MPFASLLIPHYGKLKFIVVNASAFPPEDFTAFASLVKAGIRTPQPQDALKRPTTSTGSYVDDR
jgi:hypothetical protein